jgi:hypothetical protein
MHTEEQAKQLWCPHVRLLEPSFYKRGPATQGSTVGHEPASVNRGETRCKDTNCIGSKCSQWRWAWGDQLYPVEDGFKNDGTGKGYCGLAGKP